MPKKKLSKQQAREMLYGNQTGKQMPSYSRTTNHEFSIGQRLLADHIKLDGTTNSVANDLLRDIFQSIYRGTRQTLKRVPNLNREFNRSVIEKLMKNSSWRKSVSSLTGRRVSSKVAAEEVFNKLLEDEETQEALDMMQDADDLEEQAEQEEKKGKGKSSKQDKNQDQQDGDQDSDQDGEDDQQDSDGQDDGQGEDGDDSDYGDGEDNDQQDQSDDEGEDGKGNEDDNGKGSSKKANKMRQQAEELREQVAEKFAEKMNQIGAKMEMGNAMKEGKEDGEAVAAFLSSMGIDEGANSTLSPEDIEKILALFKKGGLAALANLIGRSLGAARDVLRGRAPIELLIDEAGNTHNFDYVFSDQQALMSPMVDDRVRLPQINDFIQRGLSGMQQTSQAEFAGIKIFAVDSSGSMTQPVNNADRDNDGYKSWNDPDKKWVTRAEASCGLVLGLFRATKESGQKCDAFKFSGRGRVSESVTDQSSISELIDWISLLMGGDTCFNTMMNHSMDIIESYPEDDRFQADINIITDGESWMDDATLKRYLELKKVYGTRLYMLTIGETSTGAMEKVADYLFEFASLEDASDKLAQLMFIAPRENERKEF